MRTAILLCAIALTAGLCPVFGQSSVPSGTASTALGAGAMITGSSVQGSMGSGVNAPSVSVTAPTVPGAVTINSNGSSLGTGNVAGSVQINSGGPGTVTGVPAPVSPIPTYVVPGTGLGSTTTTTNPNPGSVQ